MRLNTVEFLLREGWQAAVRNGLMTLAAVSNIAVALFLLGGLILAGVNVEHMAALQAESAVITVELGPGADAATVEKALWSDGRIEEVKFIAKEEALERTIQQLGLDILSQDSDLLGENVLPDAFHVRTVDPQDIPEVAGWAEGIEGVGLVRYAEQVTSKLLTLAQGIRISGIVLGILMVVATLMIVSTTIRLTVYARRQEIRIMQLVGATKWFIRVPFVIEGILDGLAGGAVAAAVLLPMYSYTEQYLDQNLQFLDLIYSTEVLLLFGIAVVVCGVLFGAAGSLLGLHRYLRQV